jgi:hypothetical protein
MQVIFLSVQKLVEAKSSKKILLWLDHKKQEGDYLASYFFKVVYSYKTGAIIGHTGMGNPLNSKEF